ncbi:MAG: hypothetical protein IPN71_00155 [Fibrobacteres bacterium]|nr:hypothetical protein [Fibrobacterota bacterium]
MKTWLPQSRASDPDRKAGIQLVDLALKIDHSVASKEITIRKLIEIFELHGASLRGH